MRVQLTQDVSRERNIPTYANRHHGHTYANGHHAAGGAALCRYFANGLCNRGSQCPFSHSLQAKRPVCNFFFSLQVSVPPFSGFSSNGTPLLLLIKILRFEIIIWNL